MLTIPMAVVETPGFLREAAIALSGKERTEAIRFLAANPEAGDVMPGTGGGRKVRWRAEGQGNRGSVRVIYYFHNESLPIFLLSVFSKSEKTDLTRPSRTK